MNNRNRNMFPSYEVFFMIVVVGILSVWALVGFTAVKVLNCSTDRGCLNEVARDLGQLKKSFDEGAK